MVIGKTLSRSPILAAIREAEAGTTGEIQVFLTKRWPEGDPLKKAEKLFRYYGLERTTDKNAILLYMNLRSRKFAVTADKGFSDRVDRNFWNRLSYEFSENLRSTHIEKAIALTVSAIGAELKKAFPAYSQT